MQATRAIQEALRVPRHRPPALTSPLQGAAVVAALLLFGAACQTKSLHPSHGLRFREVQAAQVNARGAHEPVAHGDEAVLPMQLYLQKLSGDDSGNGNGGGMQPQPTNATAGVKPLVR